MSMNPIKECPSCGHQSFYIDGSFLAEARVGDFGVEWKFAPVSTHDGAAEEYLCRCQGCGYVFTLEAEELLVKTIENLQDEEPDLDVLEYDVELAHDLLLESQERDSIDNEYERGLDIGLESD